jgi:hypothetical protein
MSRFIRNDEAFNQEQQNRDIKIPDNLPFGAVRRAAQADPRVKRALKKQLALDNNEIAEGPRGAPIYEVGSKVGRKIKPKNKRR